MLTRVRTYVCCVHVLVPDIPDDEAQYWTGKLERINTMTIDDEVKCSLTRFGFEFSCFTVFTKELNMICCLFQIQNKCVC